MKKYVIILMAIVMCLGVSACNKTLVSEKRGNDSVISIGSEDKEMNLIIDKARQSVKEFLSELDNPNTKGTDFSVKYPFNTDPGSQNTKEHI